MKNARLTSLTIERFKSFETGKVTLKPLTILLGRNNSGKSSIIQSLLLLKQTLDDTRPDVMLNLDDGPVQAFSLRELTFGWPSANNKVKGPTISLEWECEVDVKKALENGPNLANLAKHSGVKWLASPPDSCLLKTHIVLHTIEVNGSALISEIQLSSYRENEPPHIIKIDLSSDVWSCSWDGKDARSIEIGLDHFIPYLRIDRSRDVIGSRSIQRSYYNAYLVLFAQPLSALKHILKSLHYLGANRQPPHSLFKLATTAPNEIGISGEFAAQLLHRRQNDIIHFTPPLNVDGEKASLPEQVLARPFVDAVHQVMQDLSINTPLHILDIEQVGFRLMFGNASIDHVGRGLGHLLPLVELGLFADPLRFTGKNDSLTLDEYHKKCESISHIALEEPESHLHPKVASRLAHWFVSLARSNRQIIVETHSDHLVRRLRGLAARAESGSELEHWLISNVVILSVEQDNSGRSFIKTSYLKADGTIGEEWPADFMDESSDEESAIYYAHMEKSEATSVNYNTEFVELSDDAEPELDEEP